MKELEEYLKGVLDIYLQNEADEWFSKIASQSDEEISPQDGRRLKSSFISGFLMGLNFYTEILPGKKSILLEMEKRIWSNIKR